MDGQGRRRPTRADVLRAIQERFPPHERDAALQAVDVFADSDEAVRARMQLTIIDRSGGHVAAARELAHHLLIESGTILPPRDPEAERNERYAG